LSLIKKGGKEMSENQAVQREELKKTMGIWDYFTLGFGAMVGVGWVITVGDWIAKAGGPLGAVIAFALGGLLLIPVGLVFGELCSSMPVSGGEMAFAYKGFGVAASFFTGWLLCLAYIILCPWEAIAIGNLAAVIFPFIDFGEIYAVGGYPVKWPLLVLDLVIAFIIIGLNIKGADKAAKFQTIMCNLLLVCSAIFIVVGIVKGDIAHSMPLWGQPVGYDLSPVGGMLAILCISPFFFAGFDTIPQSAEEAGEGTDYKKLGGVISFVIFSGILFYALAIFSCSMIVPWQELVKFDFPAADAISLISPIVAKIVLFGALCGLVTTFNAFFVASSRILFGMGRSRMIPAWFGVIHPEYKTPINAIKFIAVITVIGPFLGKVLILPLVNVGALAFMMAWGICCAAAARIRKKYPNMVRPYTVPGGAAMCYLATGICALVCGLLLFPGSPAMLVWPLEWAIAAGWIILGQVFYHSAAKSRASISEEEREYLIFGDIVKEN